MAKDSAAWIELGRSFHQEGTYNLIVIYIYIYVFKMQQFYSKKTNWLGLDLLF